VNDAQYERVLRDVLGGGGVDRVTELTRTVAALDKTVKWMERRASMDREMIDVLKRTVRGCHAIIAQLIATARSQAVISGTPMDANVAAILANIEKGNSEWDAEFASGQETRA